MNVLVRARGLLGRPVVTFGGEDVAEVKDVVLSVSSARVVGFTLNGRGFFSSPLKEALPWSGVHAVGPDAVMIASPDALDSPEEVLREVSPVDRDVIGNRVLTDDGTGLGEVTDVILALGGEAEIVGYEFVGSEHLAARRGQRLYIPLPDTIAVSGEALIVPAAATDYVRDDLSGFGSAVDEFRARLRRGS